MLNNHLSQTAETLLQATAGVTGDRFFAALVEALADTVGTRWALIGERHGDKVSVLAGYCDGAPLDPFEYELPGSPCEEAMCSDTCTYTQGVATCFPRDKLLVEMGVESYFGIGIYDSAGEPIGILAAFDDKPMTESPDCEALLKLFAMRAGAEIERRRLEQHLIHSQKLKSLGVLAGGIAHDFNNLLVGILGNIESALSAISDSNQTATESLNDASAASQAAAELTKQLLAYAGGATTDRQAISIADHVQATVTMVRRLITAETSITTLIPDDLPAVMGDPSQLRQVLLNLVTNANEALAGNAGSVTIKVEPVNASSEYDHCLYRAKGFNPSAQHVAIRVRDTGGGMDHEAKLRIFDPFYSSKGPSRGLGLSAVLGILSNHDGAIAIDTSKGHGSTFTVYLPTTTESVPSVSSAEPQLLGNSQRVLIVDDNDIVRNTLARTLRRLGYEVVESGSGEKSLAIVVDPDAKIDCMVIDRIMPGLSGPQLIGSIRKLGLDVPIVLTTGFGDSGELPSDAISGVLSKPWTAADVSRAVRHALGHSAE